MMKSILPFLFALAAISTSAQEAGIFYYAIQLDDDLITMRQRVDNDRKVFTQTTDRVMVSEQLVDSIRLGTQKLLSDYFSSEVVMIEKKSDAVFSAALPSGMVEGLPFQSLKKGQKIEPNLKQYIKIYLSFKEKARMSASTKSSKTDARYTERWLIKPQVKVQLKIFDSDRKLVDNRSSTFDDLPPLKKKVLNWDEKQFSKAKTLSGYDIYYYTMKALEAVLNDE
jgi:hypothetical protein